MGIIICWKFTLLIRIYTYKYNIIIISLFDKAPHVILVYRICLITLNFLFYKERDRTNSWGILRAHWNNSKVKKKSPCGSWTLRSLLNMFDQKDRISSWNNIKVSIYWKWKKKKDVKDKYRLPVSKTVVLGIEKIVNCRTKSNKQTKKTNIQAKKLIDNRMMVP